MPDVRHRVLIIDDHALLGESLARLLGAHDMAAEWCADAQGAWERIGAGQWDVILLDVSMPDVSGLELLGQIKRAHPTLPVLMLSMHPEQQFALRALRGGAAGYLTKGCSPEQVIEAVRTAARGGRYLTPNVAERLAIHLEEGEAADTPHSRLSEREMQVFMRLVQGVTVNEIAEELHISAKTVSTHKARLMHKMQLDKDADLVRYAMRYGLVS